jgi:hypothetical protein
MAAAGCRGRRRGRQYGQRRHSSCVTLFGDVNFANPFYIIAKEPNQGLRVAELQISRPYLLNHSYPRYACMDMFQLSSKQSRNRTLLGNGSRPVRARDMHAVRVRASYMVLF